MAYCKEHGHCWHYSAKCSIDICCFCKEVEINTLVEALEDTLPEIEHPGIRRDTLAVIEKTRRQVNNAIQIARETTGVSSKARPSA